MKGPAWSRLFTRSSTADPKAEGRRTNPKLARRPYLHQGCRPGDYAASIKQGLGRGCTQPPAKQQTHYFLPLVPLVFGLLAGFFVVVFLAAMSQTPFCYEYPIFGKDTMPPGTRLGRSRPRLAFRAADELRRDILVARAGERCDPSRLYSGSSCASAWTRHVAFGRRQAA
jgi:hypothetical protein